MNVKTRKNPAIVYKKQGILVFRTGRRLTASVVRATIERVRKEREQKILGKKWITRDEAKRRFQNL
jgi:hypothetical protein